MMMKWVTISIMSISALDSSSLILPPVSVLSNTRQCAVSTENEIRCWGNNRVGNLGIGDTRNPWIPYEDNEEMGDALPLVDLGIATTGAPTTTDSAGSCVLSVMVLY